MGTPFPPPTCYHQGGQVIIPLFVVPPLELPPLWSLFKFPTLLFNPLRTALSSLPRQQGSEPCDLLWAKSLGTPLPSGSRLRNRAEELSNFIFTLFLLDDHSCFTYISSEGLQGQRHSKSQIWKLFSSSCALIFYSNLAPKPAQNEKLEGVPRMDWSQTDLCPCLQPSPDPTPAALSLKWQSCPGESSIPTRFTHIQHPSQDSEALSWSIQLPQECPLWPTFLEPFLLQISRF